MQRGRRKEKYVPKEEEATGRRGGAAGEPGSVLAGDKRRGEAEVFSDLSRELATGRVAASTRVAYQGAWRSGGSGERDKLLVRGNGI